MKRTSIALLCVAAFTTSLRAAPGNSADGIVRGPFFSGTIMQKGGKAATANKGLVVTVGPDKRHYICYDLDTMRVSMAWSGDYLEFGKTQERIEWPPPPVAKGQIAFDSKVAPGWSLAGSFADPRPNQIGPLPKAWARHEGIHVHGEKVVLEYTVGGAKVLEMPGLESRGGVTYFTRTFSISPTREPLRIYLAEHPRALPGEKLPENDSFYVAFVNVRSNGLPAVAAMKNEGTSYFLDLPKLVRAARFKVLLWRADATNPAQKVATAIQTLPVVEELTPLLKGGKPLWPDAVTTQGTLGSGDAPYVVDTITEPVPNPWNAKTYFGGFDFFPDGRAAICTFHGDVWIVSGIDDKLDKLSWRRFATGLFQPLGLKIVDGKIHVLGRDQITRLHDLNNDAEADFYENFNNDSIVTPNYHEFSMDLHTDSKGNFYYAKGSPWTPDVTSPHQGTIIRVTKDGSRMDILATGLRAPNGMGMGPKDELTVSDNQGHWMPASKLNWVTRGGFYGMMPAAQRELTMRRDDGTELKMNPSDPALRKTNNVAPFDKAAPIPTSYAEPMLWLPMNMDNSSGGQAWATSDKWGPFKNHLLFMSYGKGTLFHVMHETVGGAVQAAAWQFPLKFNSGTMRARINPKDGQLYTCGLRGWQTSGVRDGAFQRVRFTGKPVLAPLDFHVRPNGVAITFTCALDESLARDPGSWSLERWNYLYSGAYGSADYSVENPSEKKRDRIEVTAAKLSPDKRTVTLEFPVRPANQMRIKYNLKSADGTAMSSEIYSTVHKVPGK
jgi:hypothetical protein